MYSCICTLHSPMGHVSLSPTLLYKHLSRREEIPNYLVDCILELQGNPLMHLDHVWVHLRLKNEMRASVDC